MLQKVKLKKAGHVKVDRLTRSAVMKMVEDGRLRSPLGVKLVEGEKREAIKNALHLSPFKTYLVNYLV
ncbi:MAG: hypothetical protein RL262_565 [Bacteroidota bacterium]